MLCSAPTNTIVRFAGMSKLNYLLGQFEELLEEAKFFIYFYFSMQDNEGLNLMLSGLVKFLYTR